MATMLTDSGVVVKEKCTFLGKTKWLNGKDFSEVFFLNNSDELLFSLFKNWYKVGDKGVWSEGGAVALLGIKFPKLLGAPWSAANHSFYDRLSVGLSLKKSTKDEALINLKNKTLACEDGLNVVRFGEMSGDDDVRCLSIDCKGGYRPADKGYADKRYLGVKLFGAQLYYDASLEDMPLEDQLGSEYLSDIAYALKCGISIKGSSDVERYLTFLVDKYSTKPFMGKLKMESDIVISSSVVSGLGLSQSLSAKIFKCYFDLIKKKEVRRKGGLYLSSRNASDVLYEIPFEFSMPVGPDEVGKEDDRLDVVQYWEGSRVPKETLLFKEKLERLGFEHTLFNKEMAREFIGKNYSRGVLRLFDMAWHPAMESDIFRVLYCALNSSVYLDADWQLKDSGSLFFPIGAADVWFRLLYRNSGPSNLHGPYIGNDMLCFKSRGVGKTFSDMLIKDLWRFEGKGEARDILSLTGPGFFARSVLNMGLIFSGDNLERRVEAGGSALPVYRTPYGRVGFLGNEHFKGLRVSANMKLSEEWSEKGIASDWRSHRFGGVK